MFRYKRCSPRICLRRSGLETTESLKGGSFLVCVARRAHTSPVKTKITSASHALELTGVESKMWFQPEANLGAHVRVSSLFPPIALPTSSTRCLNPFQRSAPPADSKVAGSAWVSVGPYSFKKGFATERRYAEWRALKISTTSASRTTVSERASAMTIDRKSVV